MFWYSERRECYVFWENLDRGERWSALKQAITNKPDLERTKDYIDTRLDNVKRCIRYDDEISIAQKIDAICEHLGLEIVKEVREERVVCRKKEKK